MKQVIRGIFCTALTLTVFTGCAGNEASVQPSAGETAGGSRHAASTGTVLEETAEADRKNNMKLEINEYEFLIDMEENQAVDQLKEMVRSGPVEIQMEDYAGSEKAGSLGTMLPREDVQMTTDPGDMVLYNGNQIVIFYGHNSWSYTKLGHVNDLSSWQKALGSGDITMMLKMEE